MKKAKKWMALFLSTLLLVSSCACSQESGGNSSSNGNGSSGSPEEQEELIPVTVSEFRGICWASAYLGYELGFFEDEGLDLEFMLYKDGPIAFQGMHAGDSDFCLLSIEPVMTAYDEGMES